MDTELSPREIQARLRAGESLPELAEAAGVTPEAIHAFAAPVLAERDNVASIALSSPVRRRGESVGGRTLWEAIDERLASRGRSAKEVEWNAWRREDRRWAVTASFRIGRLTHEALFTFDLRSRFSVPVNDEGRWLTGEIAHLPLDGEEPGEATVDLDDELAIVRAVSTDTQRQQLRSFDDDWVAQSYGSPQELGDAIEAELEADTNDIDVAEYDPGEHAPDQPELEEWTRRWDEPWRQEGTERGELDVLWDLLAQPRDPRAQQYRGRREEDRTQAPEPTTAQAPTPQTTPQAPTPAATPPDPVGEPEPSRQPALDGGEETVALPAPRRRGRKKRASVPSWDEIMFGGPDDSDR